MIENILHFWFEEAAEEKWYIKDPAFDADIKARFESVYEEAGADQHKDWAETPVGALALVILLDQFPRNMFRDTPKAFATDGKALTIARLAISRGYDKEIDIHRSRFFYLPFMHSEKLEDQKECVRLFTEVKDQVSNLPWAIAHLDVITRFGRFPHRNNILGRESTPEEKQYLAEGGGF